MDYPEGNEKSAIDMVRIGIRCSVNQLLDR